MITLCIIDDAKQLLAALPKTFIVAEADRFFRLSANELFHAVFPSNIEGYVIRANKNGSRRQTVLSIVILSMLAVIGAGLTITQNRYNPAILSKDEVWPSAHRPKLPAPPSALEAFSPLP